MAKKFNDTCAACHRGFRADNARQDCVYRLLTPTTREDIKGPICERCEGDQVKWLHRRRAATQKRNLRHAEITEKRKGESAKRAQERIDAKIAKLQQKKAELGKEGGRQ